MIKKIREFCKKWRSAITWLSWFFVAVSLISAGTGHFEGWDGFIDVWAGAAIFLGGMIFLMMIALIFGDEESK